MVFIKIEKESDYRAKIVLIHNMPELLTDEEKAGGILIDSVAEPPGITGKMVVPYYAYSTKEIIYEYVDLPKTEVQILNTQMSAILKSMIR